MEKLKMHSPNLTQENIARIRELFPGCVTEAHDNDGKVKLAVDFDQLRQELSEVIVEGPQERYHLNWPGKREALLAANAPIAKTLRPCREESVDFDTTENLFIEGDNLDALKLLQENYLGKIKMIYIDPPYNTGKDFIYSDNFAETADEFLLESGQKDEEGNRLVSNSDSNGRFHSDWLSMMYSRLKLARNLLKDDGVIFISIDDGEQANLKRVCDEILGERNFVANIVWQKKQSPQNDATYFSAMHDHILVYAKIAKATRSDSFGWDRNLLPRDEQQNSRYSNPDEDPRGDWASVDCTCNKTSIERPNLYYPIINPNNGQEVWPSTQRVWRYEKSTMDQLLSENRISWGQEGNNFPRQKRFLSEVQDGIVPSTWWTREFSSDNQAARRELRSIFRADEGDFNTPKPIGLITRMLQISTTDKDLVLDFFAGSSSTAHAVMQLNAEDQGNRKFIMVQLPEECDEKSEAFKAGYKTIAEISKERIRRAGKKIKEENPLTTKELDIGFRVLKVDSSNLADIYYTPDSAKQDILHFAIDNIKPDRTSEDLLFQVLLDWGVELSLPIKKEKVADLEVYFVDNNALAACFVKNGEINDDFCKELAKRQPLRAVFRDSGFKDDSAKINAEQIFKLLSPHTELKAI
ncbi:MAG: adenine-specific DNA-methyltransferase [Clostridiales bacterium]|nr:adenine-specific DNA-methyltransferase [Clostridiales bacterium]MDN5281458.1 adenine-specific DNA-methyltransferase [Candidatus Ozemobacter sp.]